MGIQDREWYQEAWDQRNKIYHGDLSTDSKPDLTQELSTYRIVKCKNCGEEIYVHSPEKIGSKGFPYKCSFCGATSRLYDKRRGTGGRVLLAVIILLAAVLIGLNLLVYFGIIPEAAFYRYVIFLR